MLHYLAVKVCLLGRCITDVLKEAFLKIYKPLPPMFLVKFPSCSNSYSKEQLGTAFSLLILLVSSVNWLSCNIHY